LRKADVAKGKNVRRFLRLVLVSTSEIRERKRVIFNHAEKAVHYEEKEKPPDTNIVEGETLENRQWKWDSCGGN